MACHLHAAGSGSVDTTHHVPGTPVLNEDSARAAHGRPRRSAAWINLPVTWTRPVATQDYKPFRRYVVMAAGICSRPTCEAIPCTRLWKPRLSQSEVMYDCKIYASRRLNRMRLD